MLIFSHYNGISKFTRGFIIGRDCINTWSILILCQQMSNLKSIHEHTLERKYINVTCVDFSFCVEKILKFTCERNMFDSANLNINLVRLILETSHFIGANVTNLSHVDRILKFTWWLILEKDYINTDGLLLL